MQSAILVYRFALRMKTDHEYKCVIAVGCTEGEVCEGWSSGNGSILDERTCMYVTYDSLELLHEYFSGSDRQIAKKQVPAYFITTHLITTRGEPFLYHIGLSLSVRKICEGKLITLTRVKSISKKNKKNRNLISRTQTRNSR